PAGDAGGAALPLAVAAGPLPALGRGGGGDVQPGQFVVRHPGDGRLEVPAVDPGTGPDAVSGGVRGSPGAGGAGGGPRRPQAGWGRRGRPWPGLRDVDLPADAEARWAGGRAPRPRRPDITPGEDPGIRRDG